MPHGTAHPRRVLDREPAAAASPAPQVDEASQSADPGRAYCQSGRKSTQNIVLETLPIGPHTLRHEFINAAQVYPSGRPKVATHAGPGRLCTLTGIGSASVLVEASQSAVRATARSTSLVPPMKCCLAPGRTATGLEASHAAAACTPRTQR